MPRVDHTLRNAVAKSGGDVTMDQEPAFERG
jgi:hypothetical protein